MEANLELCVHYLLSRLMVFTEPGSNPIHAWFYMLGAEEMLNKNLPDR